MRLIALERAIDQDVSTRRVARVDGDDAALDARFPAVYVEAIQATIHAEAQRVEARLRFSLDFRATRGGCFHVRVDSPVQPAVTGSRAPGWGSGWRPRPMRGSHRSR